MDVRGHDPKALGAMVQHLRSICPAPLHLMALLGEPVDEHYLSAFCERYGSDWLSFLLDHDQAVARFEAIWKHVHGRERWELLELLICEHWISAQPRDVSGVLSSEMRLDKTLHTVRGAVAVALYGRAKSVNWREPLTFVRALRVAETYLNSVVENAALTREESRSAFQGRLGVCRVLQSRYIDLPRETVQEAIANLENSIEGGNSANESYSYLAEALLRSYDLTGVPDQLVKLIKLQRNLRSDLDSPQLRAIVAEAWLRLADRATGERRGECADTAGEIAASLMSNEDPLLYVRGALIRPLATVKRQHGEGLAVRGLRMPFGLKRHLRDWAELEPESASEVAKGVVTALAEAPAHIKHDPIFRRIDASVRSALGEILPPGTSIRLRTAWTTSAVDQRASGPGRSRLSDPESGLENVLDLFWLRSLDRNDEPKLVAAVEAALSLADFDQAWPTPLIVLAREVASWDAPLSAPAIYRIRQHPLRSHDIRNRVLDRDAPGLYELAAERALASREVDRKHLGGRTGVYLAEDYSGVVQDNFVFKPTTVALADREERRVAIINDAIREAGMEHKFELPLTMARSELPPGDPLRRNAYEVIVARQYHSGETLSDYVQEALDRKAALAALRLTVSFLALIHVAESCDPGAGLKMRSQLWSKEFGRWLKALRIENRANVFADWWSIFDGCVPCYKRRDAHPLNWIVTPRRDIIAVDFEATGWRPAGYELAQLTDDFALLPVNGDGWKERKELLAEYRNRLCEDGAIIEEGALWDAYEASLVARAVRLLSDPVPSSRGREHGVQLLRYLAAQATHVRVRSIAKGLHEAWLVRLGVASDPGRAVHPITEARRRRLSRALAYELRHGSEVSLDVHGWATASDLADALNRAGLHTNSAELQSVASAFDEPRYDVERGYIRARYGHTRKVQIQYESQAVSKPLYHGTAVANLNHIFEGEGLRSMRRLWVHLSSDPGAAIRTAKRHGPSVLLVVDCARVPADVFEAGGPVYLAESVPAETLRIATPTELFLMGHWFGSG